ncbi:hypothetical protein XENOCAPTIV_028264 [Xenoophorus captivus]|uniref:Uncharacterized protein n=1 Tax=Xenoophorus captivus TaxID=1517983 RepID=A0ABV0Q6L7_9TELE
MNSPSLCQVSVRNKKSRSRLLKSAFNKNDLFATKRTFRRPMRGDDDVTIFASTGHSGIGQRHAALSRSLQLGWENSHCTAAMDTEKHVPGASHQSQPQHSTGS